MPEVSYNCSCDDEYEKETMAALIAKVLRRSGYAQQVAPAAVRAVIRDILTDAQTFLFNRYDVFRMERFFSWPLVPGTKFYDLPGNVEGQEPVVCAAKLDPHRITWVGVEGSGGDWRELVNGIPPTLYSSPQVNTRPYRYEIRQCIELFPTPGPDAEILRIKGYFKPLRFVEDEDETSLDPLAIFYHATGVYKRMKGHQDAEDYFGMEAERISDLTAGSHHTRRYVPGQAEPAQAVRPRFLPLEE